ncbi:TPA: hypothetical protein ACWSRJ_000914 [Klebsiella pneumoniae]
MTKVFVTKYALSSGPFHVEAELKERSAFWRVCGYQNSAHGNDFWLTEEEALADCERRRQAKLRSIDKLRKKLEDMDFTILEQKAD